MMLKFHFKNITQRQLFLASNNCDPSLIFSIPYRFCHFIA